MFYFEFISGIVQKRGLILLLASTLLKLITKYHCDTALYITG